ncbi:TIGR00300 family protein [Vulcanimicrobium alpinum]|uniref:ornithine cyclodeaminase n=1 Tax=Vulcanimicrobium alpinum TaxID=3016050 RepID=A0AAN2C8E1_UNVUL|nr:TIGR00300 family protein [Vulcanimicrobium alpinum]BDE04931.1 TIGR00300 family protein [Vulcanimicrobium alpinum]
MASASSSATVVRRIELRGHILDSGIFNRVLGVLTDHERAAYVIEEFDSGRTKVDPSYARLAIEADDQAYLDELIDKLREQGAEVMEEGDAATEPAPADGVLPDQFYATTNYATEVRVGGSWLPVANPEMDCAIVLDDGGALTVPPSDVKAGDPVVVGHQGVKVSIPQRARRKAVFEFMASAVSSEKPRHALLGELARELLAVLRSGKRVLVVGGPAIIHTGAGPYLADLIRGGYVTALYAGNALAVHDMESQFFGTSLGVNLEDAFPAEEGHVHHLRTVNRLRAAGGIRNAIDRGILRAGVMYEAYQKKIPVVLCGSIRDDGPIPDVITDVVEAQRAMRAYVPQIGMALMVCTLLHSVAVGNLLPATCKTVCVDINPSSVTKLTDRGSHQTLGIVMDASSFLRELTLAIEAAEAELGSG